MTKINWANVLKTHTPVYMYKLGNAYFNVVKVDYGLLSLIIEYFIKFYHILLKYKKKNHFYLQESDDSYPI